MLVIVRHYAFDSKDDQLVGSNFKNIGNHIIKKCGMLPLAVKSIASLLRYETDEESWREIQESKLWETDASNAIFPSLQLSYARLPTYLKPCLIFCSMFPKDYYYNLQNLVELWISQGYIESKGNKSAEKIGFRYGKQLWERSFFEGSNETSTPWKYFKLHDLIHDLARLNSKNGCFSIGDGSSSKLPDFSYETLRTLMIKGRGAENFVRTVDHSLPQKVRALEVVDVPRNYELGYNGDKFVSSVGNLKHLHYLSLGNLLFKKFPECICSLYNLQNLKILNCTFNELPEGTQNLISLETLEISSCHLLECLPESLCELKALRNIKIKYCEELQKLPTNMGNLVSLETLGILGCGLLERLPESLCELKALRSLTIESCEQLWKLPPRIGNLVSLETLDISSCDLLEWLPESFCQLKALSKLVLLRHSLKELPNDMGNLTNLQSLQLGGQGALPPSWAKIVGIQSLCVCLACEKIGWLRDFHNLCRPLCLSGLENVSDLVDVQCANITSMHNLESLKLDWSDEVPHEEEEEISLEIMEGHIIYREDHCEVMAALQPHPNLRKLEISYYGGSTFPEWIGNPSSYAHHLKDLKCTIAETLDSFHLEAFAD